MWVASAIGDETRLQPILRPNRLLIANVMRRQPLPRFRIVRRSGARTSRELAEHQLRSMIDSARAESPVIAAPCYRAITTSPCRVLAHGVSQQIQIARSAAVGAAVFHPPWLP